MNIDEAIKQAEHELLIQPTYNSIKERLALLRFVQAWDEFSAHHHESSKGRGVVKARAAVTEALK